MTEGAMTGFRILRFVALMLSVLPVGAQAQDYPDRAVRIVVPFAPGGVIDPVARIVAKKLQDHWGQPVVIENRPGASTTIGTAAVAKAAPDGYTLLFTSRQHATNPIIFKSLPYDTQKDFTPIALTTFGDGQVIVVHPSLGVKTVAALVERARREPGVVTFASGGFGNVTHISGEMFNMLTNVRMNHIPYKGTGPAMNDVIAGHAKVMFAPISVALPHIRAGTVIALGYAGPERSKEVPDVPTVAEFPQLGLEKFDVRGWHGILGPAHMPPAIVQTIYAHVRRIVSDPEMQSQWDKMGLTPMIETYDPPAFARFLDDDIAFFEKVGRAVAIEKQ
jgi:tripartite-type tricarboxylate transporter receptor subunit TctC